MRLYEWYPSDWICGGCGYTFSEGRPRASMKARRSMQEFVQDNWPTTRRLREVVRTLCDEIHSQGETGIDTENQRV